MWYNTWYNIGGGGDVIIRVFERYLLKYVPLPANQARYVRPSKINFAYLAADSIGITYVESEESGARYVRPVSFKLKYKVPENIKMSMICKL